MANAKLPCLRKACRNCTVAKRRCIVRLPYCERCSKRGLECSYDLEPLGTPPATPNPMVYSVSGSLPIHCLLNQEYSKSRGETQPTFKNDVREGIDIVRSTLRGIPSRAIQQKPSVFIHPSLRSSLQQNWLSAAIHDIRTIPDILPSHENFRALLQTRSTSESLETVLPAVQAFMLYLLAFTFCSTSEARACALSYVEDMTSRVQQLERIAGAFTGRGFTPWQAWLFGESTRRTILTSHILTCVFFRDRYEIAKEKLRMEALPFDDRAGLWLAESPQAWVAAAGARRGSEVKVKLVSWHEFGCMNPPICMSSDGDMFLSMMLVAHNGKRWLETNRDSEVAWR